MDLINREHPHAGNYHLRQVLEHTAKLLDEVEKQRLQGAATQSLTPLKAAEKFSAKAIETLTEAFKKFDKPWSGGYIFVPTYKEVAEQARADLKLFTDQIAVVKAATQVIRDENKMIATGIVGLLETLGVPKSRHEQKPKSRKLFDFIEISAGYITDIARSRDKLENDDTFKAQAAHDNAKRSLDAWWAAQNQLEKEHRSSEYRSELYALSILIKELYGFYISGNSIQDMATSLAMGLSVRESANLDNGDYAFNKRVTDLVGRLYVNGDIDNNTMSRIYSYLPIGEAQHAE